jgi:hypothetical protein
MTCHLCYLDGCNRGGGLRDRVGKADVLAYHEGCHCAPMIFRPAEAAEQTWRRLDWYSQLPKVILGVVAVRRIAAQLTWKKVARLFAPNASSIRNQ